MLFDTHAHYDAHQFDDDRDTLLAALPEQGVGWVVDPGCDIPSSRKAVELAERFPHVYAAVGFQPEECGDYTSADLEVIRALALSSPKVVAIGEIGLDYHYEDIPRDLQKKAFRLQMALAKELNLPVIVHEREAHADALEILDEFPTVTGVFHCYSGSAEMAKELVHRGWYIGFTGVLTFKNAKKAVEVAKSLPHDRLVLETDCPYMAPEPFRGKRNHPGYLYRMAEKLAELWELPVEEVQTITLENGKRLYHI